MVVSLSFFSLLRARAGLAIKKHRLKNRCWKTNIELREEFFERLLFENNNSKKINGVAHGSNKKALIKKEKTFRQSIENQMKTEKKKRNTRSAEAFLCLACLHPRTHPCSCLSFRFYSFRAVYINSNRLSRTIFCINMSNSEKRTAVHINERKPELFHIYSCKQTFFQSQDKLHNYAATCDINHEKVQLWLDLTAFLQNGSKANNFRKKQIIYCIEIA